MSGGEHAGVGAMRERPAWIDDPYPSYRFYVQFDNKMQALFTEVSGLRVELAVQDVEEGGNNEFVHRLPGRAKVSNITLKKGMTRSREFLEWLLDISKGTIKRRHVTVVMYDTARKVVLRWNFHHAYPVKWSGPDFKSSGSEAAMESLELTHKGMGLG
jgi:phage tail-like protein